MMIKTGWLVLVVAVLVHAHGGGTDANGCHTNRKTGDYHCHTPKSPSRNPSATSRVPGSGEGFTCGTKTVCKQMASCEEAYYYLNTCGLNRLDRDQDGIPCESICN